MREIKFRGKLINKYAEEWFYGDLIQVKDGTVDKKGNPAIDYYIITDDYSSKYNKIELRTCQSPKVNADTIGQYTGLKDKNGVEIYEGDIVYCQTKFGKAKAIIEFINGKFVARFDSAVTHPQNGHYISYYEINKRFEVIGNIYDNPELLKESDLNDNCTSNKNKRWRNICK